MVSLLRTPLRHRGFQLPWCRVESGARAREDLS